MKYILLVMAICAALLVCFYVRPAECTRCAPTECYYDISCGFGCWCYKGQWEFQGRCVPR